VEERVAQLFSFGARVPFAQNDLTRSDSIMLLPTILLLLLLRTVYTARLQHGVLT